MRLIDADALHSTLADWQLMLSETYGTNDEFVRCLEDVLCTIDNTPTIAAPRWVRVEEPPKENGRYLVHWQDVVTTDEFKNSVWLYASMFNQRITHWMPLPEPPKEEV